MTQETPALTFLGTCLAITPRYLGVKGPRSKRGSQGRRSTKLPRAPGTQLLRCTESLVGINMIDTQPGSQLNSELVIPALSPVPMSGIPADVSPVLVSGVVACMMCVPELSVLADVSPVALPSESAASTAAKPPENTETGN